MENHDITTECIVDANPKSDITWFGPSGQRLSSFAEEKIINATVVSSQLHCNFIFRSLFVNYFIYLSTTIVFIYAWYISMYG